jgi:hypothetical protein
MKILSINNLPHPNPEILKFILRYMNEAKNKFEIDYQSTLTEIYQNKENIILGANIRNETVTAMVQEQYQKYFDCPISSCFDYFINTNPEQGVACLPPHVHHVRTLALNYFFDIGGTDVRTCFYSRKIVDLFPKEKWGGYLSREDVTPYKYMITENNKWYAHPILVPHSVENVLTSRIFLAIQFVPTYDMSDLVLEKKLEYSNVNLFDF